MKNSRIVNIISSFSKKEVREMKKWLTSPAHNQRDDVAALFEYLSKKVDTSSERALSKEFIFKKIFPHKQFDDARLRQTIFFLSKEIEHFLIYKELMNDEIRSKMILANVFRKRKLDKSFQKTIKTIDTLQNDFPFRNENYYRNEYLIQQEQYAYQNQFKRTTSNLQEVSDALDISFVTDKLRQSCLILTHQSIYKAEYKLNLIDEVIELINDEKYREIPAITLYYFTYQTLKNPENESFFFDLKESIVNLGHFFPQSEIRDIYLLAINYCIKKMNAGKDVFVREAFELYKQGIQQEILIEEGQISHLTFLNTVFNALRLKEFAWVEEFIEKYQSYLSDRYRESFVRYSLARLYFDKGDYDAAMSFLIHVEHKDIVINLNAKTLLLKIYYKKDEVDALEALLESMRTYIQRKKIMGYHKAIFKNLIRLTKKLIHLNPYDKNQKEKLKEEISATHPISKADKMWLLEELEKT